MVMKSISVEQLAAEETWVPEVCAVPSLPFPADGLGSLWHYAGRALALWVREPSRGKGAWGAPLAPSAWQASVCGCWAPGTRPALLTSVWEFHSVLLFCLQILYICIYTHAKLQKQHRS